PPPSPLVIAVELPFQGRRLTGQPSGRPLWFLRPADEVSIGPDDVLVEVCRIKPTGRIDAVAGGVRAIPPWTTDTHHRLPLEVCRVQSVLIGMSPTVFFREFLHILGDQYFSELGTRNGGILLEIDGLCLSCACRADLICEPTEHRYARVPDVKDRLVLRRLIVDLGRHLRAS